ncbi:hypothetical protein CPB84DRAFT_381046 [Gymnopilus junonius]|uniref:Uncharacterized protein n=1 Tax=Gymnopilus junonius TaxID=109634 RepID=A0A9P5THV6_GYMJU|nr:hypothetical protein CPB84DRAFT_381046 [Gymnopilus junonius]
MPTPMFVTPITRVTASSKLNEPRMLQGKTTAYHALRRQLQRAYQQRNGRWTKQHISCNKQRNAASSDEGGSPKTTLDETLRKLREEAAELEKNERRDGMKEMEMIKLEEIARLKEHITTLKLGKAIQTLPRQLRIYGPPWCQPPLYQAIEFPTGFRSTIGSLSPHVSNLNCCTIST